MQLSKTEEDLMNYLWKLEKGFMINYMATQENIIL